MRCPRSFNTESENAQEAGGKHREASECAGQAQGRAVMFVSDRFLLTPCWQKDFLAQRFVVTSCLLNSRGPYFALRSTKHRKR